MALRLCSNIDQFFTKTCKRLFTHVTQKLNTSSSEIEEAPVIISKEKEHGNVINLDRYSAASYKRTTSKDNPRLLAQTFESEREILNRNLHNQYLQPATMPTLTDTQNEISSKLITAPQEKEILRAQTFSMNKSASQKILENKTRQFKNNPKKLPKLMSNPFPDPLKAAFSPYTICDQEKAQQMLDEQKLSQLISSSMKSKKFSTKTGDLLKGFETSVNFYGTLPLQYNNKLMLNCSTSTMPMATDQQGRFYSKQSKSEKKLCPKLKRESGGKKQCPKFILKGCPVPKCKQTCLPKKVNVNCKKVEAPYPSFSESCFMEEDPRKLSCDMCPWTTTTNPNFKGILKLPSEQKEKKYHTATARSTSSRNLFNPITDFSSKEKGKNTRNWMQSANISHLHDKDNKNEDNKLDFCMCGSSHLCDPIYTNTKHNTEDYWSRRNFCKLGKLVNKVKSEVQNETVAYNQFKNKYSGRKTKIGYCERNWHDLSNVFMKNNNLRYNYRDGDDLSDFGIDKIKLTRILCSKALYSDDCKKEVIDISDYPKNCKKPYEDKTQICPEGLTHRKTRCERLKKKKSKTQNK